MSDGACCHYCRKYKCVCEQLAAITESIPHTETYQSLQIFDYACDVKLTNKQARQVAQWHEQRAGELPRLLSLAEEDAENLREQLAAAEAERDELLELMRGGVCNNLTEPFCGICEQCRKVEGFFDRSNSRKAESE